MSTVDIPAIRARLAEAMSRPLASTVRGEDFDDVLTDLAALCDEVERLRTAGETLLWTCAVHFDGREPRAILRAMGGMQAALAPATADTTTGGTDDAI